VKKPNKGMRSLITPPSTPRLMKRAAWSLWLLPPIFLSPLLVLPFYMDPATAHRTIAELWWVYLCFLGLPGFLGAFLWKRARKLEQRAKL
jgi:hypothetical protein